MRTPHGILAALAIGLAGLVSTAAETTHVKDIIYGRKHGMALTMDILKPEKPNGIGVLFMVSGGFSSDSRSIGSGLLSQAAFKPFTDRGQTVFLVVHGSQPKFTVQEIVSDIHRAVRFVRANGHQVGVEPDRLAISGASSGGFLSLSIGAAAKEGDRDAKDPIDQLSSRVQAVACFFPPTDLVDYGKADRTFMEYEPVKFVWHTFGIQDKPREEQIKVLRQYSPLNLVSSNSAPTLIITGDNDLLVPHEQSERYIAKLKSANVAHKLEMRPGAGHGWADIQKDLELFAAWFEQHLGGKQSEPESSGK